MEQIADSNAAPLRGIVIGAADFENNVGGIADRLRRARLLAQPGTIPDSAFEIGRPVGQPVVLRGIKTHDAMRECVFEGGNRQFASSVYLFAHEALTGRSVLVIVEGFVSKFRVIVPPYFANKPGGVEFTISKLREACAGITYVRVTDRVAVGPNTEVFMPAVPMKSIEIECYRHRALFGREIADGGAKKPLLRIITDVMNDVRLIAANQAKDDPSFDGPVREMSDIYNKMTLIQSVGDQSFCNKFSVERETELISFVSIKGWTRVEAMSNSRVPKVDYVVRIDYRDIQPAPQPAGFVESMICCNYDIETCPDDITKGTDPDANDRTQKVICICGSLALRSSYNAFLKFAIGNLAGKRWAPGANTREFAGEYFSPDAIYIDSGPNETKMVELFWRMVELVDCDLISAFNGWDFDYKFMIRHHPINIAFLGVETKGTTARLRMPIEATRIPSGDARAPSDFDLGYIQEDKNYKLNPGLSANIFYLNIPGRIVLDVRQYLRREEGALFANKSSLRRFSDVYLEDGSTKDDMPFTHMFKLYDAFRKSPNKWALLPDQFAILKYCVQDADLITKIQSRSGAISRFMDTANLSRVDPDDVIASAVTKRVAQMFRFGAKLANVSVCDHTVNYEISHLFVPEEVKVEQVTFSGGYCERYKSGRFDFLMSIDFSGQYPAMMRAFNIHRSMMLTHAMIEDPELFGFRVVRPVREFTDMLGPRHDIILASANEPEREILVEEFFIKFKSVEGKPTPVWIAQPPRVGPERKLVKSGTPISYFSRSAGYVVDARAEQRKLLELAKTAGDTMAATTHDSRQAACKIMANSFYGAMGSNMFVFFSVESSSTITWCGRQLIGSVKRLIEAPEFMVTAPEFLLIKDKLDELRVKYVAVPAAEAISEFFSEYDERANAAWNLLSPEQRQMLGGVPVAFRVTAIGCKVVYIDTDSNYVHPEGFVMRTRAEHPEMSDEERLCIAANEARRYLDVLITVVNRYISRDPIKLSYEKVMAPAYLFFTKKRYVGRKPVLDKNGDLTVAGLQVPFNPKKHLVATGMDAVRRSTIELVKESQHILFSEMLKYGGIVESPGAIIQRLLEGVMQTPELEVAKIVQMHSYKPDKMNALTRVVQEWPVSRPRPTPTERIGVVVLKSKDRIVDAHGKKLPDTNASRSVIVDDYLEMRQHKLPVELDRLHYAEVLANALAPLMMVGMGAELAALLGEPAENIERQLRTAPDEDEGEEQKKAFATIKKRVVTALLRQYTSVRRAEVKCCVAVAKKVGNSQGVELSRAPDLFDPRLVAPSIECAVTCLRTLMDDIIKKGDRRRSFVKRAHADLDVVLRGCGPDTRSRILADLIASREEALVRMTQECVRVVARISEEVFEQSSADGLRIREPDYLRSQMNQLLIFNPKEFALHTKYPGYERVADLIVRLAAFKLDISNLACLISAANAALSQ